MGLQCNNSINNEFSKVKLNKLKHCLKAFFTVTLFDFQISLGIVYVYLFHHSTRSFREYSSLCGICDRIQEILKQKGLRSFKSSVMDSS
jgi:hypothetical protein